MFARRIDLVYNPACEGSVPDVLAWPCPETVLSNSCVWEGDGLRFVSAISDIDRVLTHR